MTDEATEFRELYERHTGYVVEGNVKASLADMVPSVVPAVFKGVVVPRGRATSRTILDVRKEGDRWVGDTVYETPRRPDRAALLLDHARGCLAGRGAEELPVEAK